MEKYDIPENNSLGSMEGVENVNEPEIYESKPEEEIGGVSRAEINQVIKNISQQALSELPIRLKSLVNQESLDKDLVKPDAVNNIFGKLQYLKELGFVDFDQEINDLGTLVIKMNVDHLAKYRDMVVQDLPYSHSHSINHITYKIMGPDHDAFGLELKEVYLAILHFLEHYYQIIGDYQYAEQASEYLGHSEQKEEFHRKMVDLLENGEYEKLKSFDVSTEEGRKFIRESGLVEEINMIIELSSQTSFGTIDFNELVRDLKTRIIVKAKKIQEAIDK